MAPKRMPMRKVVTDTALLVTQGKHRFYSLVLPSDVLAATCTVDPRQENPIDGFQRLLDKRRAREIAEYIDSGFGTAPCAVILSAQPRAQLHYDRASQLLRFRKNPNSFLIIDGQHRIYGFNLAKRKVSIPVVVYNKLTRAQECQLFMDINTKQRPVPPELLLDIRRLSETETEAEALLHNVFDLFCAREDSALKGLLSPSERRKGMISRVTFNAALKSIDGAFVDASAQDVYSVLNPYLLACLNGLGLHEAQANITNPALFKALAAALPEYRRARGRTFRRRLFGWHLRADAVAVFPAPQEERTAEAGGWSSRVARAFPQDADRRLLAQAVVVPLKF